MGNANSRGNHQLIVDHFCQEWAGRYQLPYPFIGGKDGDHVKRLLVAVQNQVELLKVAISRYIESDDQFLCNKAHPLCLLLSQLPQFIVAKKTLPIYSSPRARLQNETTAQVLREFNHGQGPGQQMPN